MKKNRQHQFGSTTLGTWDDREVGKGIKPLNDGPQTEENTPIRRADASVYEDVWESLYQAAEVDTSEIQVVVNEGTVTLTGFINSRVGRRTAGQIIKNIAGVVELKMNFGSEIPSASFHLMKTIDMRFHRPVD